MSTLELWHRCHTLSIRLSTNDGKLRYRGPELAVAEVLPLLRSHKDELLLLAGLPVADGPFMPYALPLSAERVTTLRAEITEAVRAIAEAECWADAQLRLVLSFLDRQPVSTLSDDLAHFRERLSELCVGDTAGRELSHQGA